MEPAVFEENVSVLVGFSGNFLALLVTIGSLPKVLEICIDNSNNQEFKQRSWQTTCVLTGDSPSAYVGEIHIHW